MGCLVDPSPTLTATSDFPELCVEWLPTEGQLSPGGDWCDITAYVVGGTAQLCGRQYEVDQFQSGDLSLTLVSNTRLWDQENSESPFYNFLVPMRQVRVSLVWNSTLYPVWRGYVTEWGETVQDDALFVTTITAKDAFAVLDYIDLVGSWYGWVIRRDKPYHWWRLNETNDATVMVDSGYGGNPADGIYNGLPTQGVQLITFDGDNGGVSFADSSGDEYGLAYLSTPLSIYTLEAWVQTADTEGVAVWMGQLDGTAMGHFYFHGSDLLTIGGAHTGVNYADGLTHHLVVTFDGSNASLYVDGVLWDTQSATPGTTAEVVSMGRQFINDPTGALVSVCVVQEVAVYDYPLTATQISDHYAYGVLGAASLDTGSHIAAVLDSYEWPDALTNIGTGVVTMGAFEQPSDSLLAYIQAVADTEMGYTFVDAQGRITHYNNQKLLIDTDAIASDHKYGDAHSSATNTVAGLELHRDDALIRNPVVASRSGGATIAAQDDDLIQKYGWRHWSAPAALNNNDNEIASRAQFLLGKFKERMPRLKSMVIQPRSDPSNLWPNALGLAVSDRFAVYRTPLGSGSESSAEQTVESIKHTFSPKDWTIEIVGAPNDSTHTYWILDTSELGVDTRLAP